MTYYTADIENLSLVMADGHYIGEHILFPSLLSDTIKSALKMPMLRAIGFISYGEPDSRLKEMFGYD